MTEPKKVVIIGSGFGGLNAAKELKRANVKITLIDKTNHHLFQPLLYQVATAALSPGDIAAPIRAVLSTQKNVTVRMSEAIGVDQKNSKVILLDGEVEYDYLVIAAGARHSYFGNEKWEKYAPGLKTISDALLIRERILLSFETAEKLTDLKEIEKHMTFVIVGAGPTGVEMAGAIAEISRQTMLRDFRNINLLMTKIILIEAGNKVLSSYSEPLNRKAKEDLEKLGVIVKLNSTVTEINENGVKVGGEFIETPNIIWAAGNIASSLIESLDVERGKFGRAIVEKDCSIKSDPNIFVIGDAALFTGEQDQVLPGVAPVAIQQGRYVGKIIGKGISKEKRKPFKYFDKGNLATIGRAKAILQIGNLKLSGFIAWILWVFIHILYLIGYRNRYKVMAEWMWYYLTKRQGVRLITNTSNTRRS